MAPKMLIDATHEEETRVVVVNGTTLEDFDFEAANRKQLKGNIYLAKVTRVEPSLQAAFVDYGGNRHGFLAFSEIHPDYYQIPVADREALLAEQHAVDAENAVDDGPAPSSEDEAEKSSNGSAENGSAGDPVETVSAEEVDEISRRPSLHQRYRIQEVIKRRQIILVQVTKEERGTKGAALTTYISLAGRYCVLMVNTTRGGGISRKIQSGEVRKRLRAVVNELNVPEGMAVILRTAGQERTKAEIKRDYEYLLRLWDSIREQTLQSTAPALIHEEANLIKRSIRDLYRSNFDGVLVEGDNGYRIAKDFMKMLMPSRAKVVQPYRDTVSLFQKYQIENQLDAMHGSTVQLKSGGYIVISLTEALVAIDVNSGRATKERNIEETATKTNLEAAEEIARQLRLRDLAGLIVIDFIDMEENRHARSVEKRLKEAVRLDRARIQMGRISAFGLLELSRQRLRPSLLESSSEICAHCEGSGRVRSPESIALQSLRAVEEEGIKGQAADLSITLPPAAAMYLLNQKREGLATIERQFEMRVNVLVDESPGAADRQIEITTPRDTPKTDVASKTEDVQTDDRDEAPAPKRKRSRRRRTRSDDAQPAAEATDGESTEATADAENASADANAEPTRSTRRRRGKRGGRRRSRARETEAGTETAGAADPESGNDANAVPIDASASPAPGETATSAPDDPASAPPAKRGRPRRAGASATKGRRIRIRAKPQKTEATEEATGDAAPSAPAADNAGQETAPAKPATRRRRTRKPAAKPATKPADGDVTAEKTAANRGGRSRKNGGDDDQPAPATSGRATSSEVADAGGDSSSRRKGWWQRITGA